MERKCWVNFQCRGFLLVWLIVGQGPIALAVGAGGGCYDIFSLVFHFSFLSPFLWETARYRLKYCLKGPFNPKQPTNQLIVGQGRIALAVGAGGVVWTFSLCTILSLILGVVGWCEGAG